MSTIKFSIVDVFSTTAYRGNPLAVVDDRENILSTTQMQLITRQFNLSETTFVNTSRFHGVKYRLRSFLPNGREVFGAGHNSLGAIWWIALNGIHAEAAAEPVMRVQGSTEYSFDVQIGEEAQAARVVQRGSEDIVVSIRQAPPTLHGKHQRKEALAHLTGLEEHEIGLGNVPAQVVSTSSSKYLAVPISSVEALRRARVDRTSILPELRTVDDHAFGLYLFTEEESQVAGNKTVQARFFSPGMSEEDPATGSAAGPLARLLHEYGRLETTEKRIQIHVKQGQAVGRECHIQVEMEKEDQDFNVSITAHCVSVADGNIVVPHATLEFCT
jgi:PhzF family phenazine biosynthesis protein